MEFTFLQGNRFVMGVSEWKGGRSVLERKRNGGLYGGTERNGSNQRGSKLLVNNPTCMISIFGFSGAPEPRLLPLQLSQLMDRY